MFSPNSARLYALQKYSQITNYKRDNIFIVLNRAKAIINYCCDATPITVQPILKLSYYEGEFTSLFITVNMCINTNVIMLGLIVY